MNILKPLLLLSFVITFIFAFILFLFKIEIKVNDAVLSVVEINENTLELEGLFVSGSNDYFLKYKEYSYEVDGNNVFIKLYKGFTTNAKKEQKPIQKTENGMHVANLADSIKFRIYVNDNFSKIENIYLIDSKDKKLIWSKKD